MRKKINIVSYSFLSPSSLLWVHLWYESDPQLSNFNLSFSFLPLIYMDLIDEDDNFYYY
jgi:hypothetical protein